MRPAPRGAPSGRAATAELEDIADFIFTRTS
jgi:hypothetical protein